jgi:hypothetical protein
MPSARSKIAKMSCRACFSMAKVSAEKRLQMDDGDDERGEGDGEHEEHRDVEHPALAVGFFEEHGARDEGQRGEEFAAHTGLSQVLSIDIFFAHSYHPWERGLSEHINGLIRQYLPKKVSFATLTKNSLTKLLLKSIIGLAKF